VFPDLNSLSKKLACHSLKTLNLHKYKVNELKYASSLIRNAEMRQATSLIDFRTHIAVHLLAPSSVWLLMSRPAIFGCCGVYFKVQDPFNKVEGERRGDKCVRFRWIVITSVKSLVCQQVRKFWLSHAPQG
jgi:hypothetical protein